MNKTLPLFTLLEPLPLLVFMVFVSLIDFGVLQDWIVAYVTCSFIATITSSLILFNKATMNRLMIGVNLYLFSGSYGLITDQTWLNQLYGDLGASAMISWIILVGIVSTCFSPVGFIGVKSSNYDRIVRYSVILIVTCLLAFMMSYQFRGNKILSEFIPFISIFLMLSKLKLKVIQSF